MTEPREQLVLFSPPPMARRTDPLSSHLAADDLEQKGRAYIQRQVVLRALKECPGSTSKELAQRSGLDRHMVARRLPELADASRWIEGASVRREDPHGKCLRWWPA